MINAIKTTYKGVEFRSRTEARWAVFFDHIGWDWKYEFEGFELPKNGRYLPDFFFPDFNAYAEVKGKKFTDLEYAKCLELSTFPCTVILLDGIPEAKTYQTLSEGKESYDVVLVPKWEKHYPIFCDSHLDTEYFSNTDYATCVARSAKFEFLNNQ